jgi:hypothetical protein
MFIVGNEEWLVDTLVVTGAENRIIGCSEDL